MMNFFIIQELKDNKWVQFDLAHYTLPEAERALEIYRLCMPAGNSMRIMQLAVINILRADKEQ